MPIKTNGASSAMQVLTDEIQYFYVFTLSAGSMTDPLTATGVNIYSTGDITDESQKNFEVLIQGIGLRAMPVIMNDPTPVADVAAEGALEITGEGYKWKFATERGNLFNNVGPNGTIGPVGLIVDEVDGIILPNSTLLTTKGVGQNIEFKVAEF